MTGRGRDRAAAIADADKIAAQCFGDMTGVTQSTAHDPLQRQDEESWPGPGAFPNGPTARHRFGVTG